jgi:hypothetical protein
LNDMSNDVRSRPSKVYYGRILLLYAVFGGLIGISIGFVRRAFEINSASWGAGITAALIVLSFPILNWLGRRRRIPWLIRYD